MAKTKEEKDGGNAENEKSYVSFIGNSIKTQKFHKNHS